MNLLKKITLVCGVVGLASCQANQPKPDVSQTISGGMLARDAGLSAQANAGRDLSEALCSGCHAIAPDQLSPNPESPGFEAIANTEGLTLVTLKDWLRDSHNFPEKMNFEVVEADVDALAAYIITLRSDDFQPVN